MIVDTTKRGVTRGRVGGGPARSERGISMVATAIVLPLFLVVLAVCFDLVRLYLNGIFAQQVAVLTMKIACSTDPEGYALPDERLNELVRGAPGETVGPGGVRAQREEFWNLAGDGNKFQGGSKQYLTEHEKKVLNLAYGFAHALNPRIYFPIPVGLGEDLPVSALGGRPNCSIYFRFPPGHEPEASLPLPGDSNYDAVMLRERDRVIHVDCAVPLVALSLGGLLSAESYRIVSRRAYAFESGSLKRGAS